MNSIKGTIRTTLVYLRDRQGKESIDLVPGDLHSIAREAILSLDGSSRQLKQISFYNGAWYAEPKDRRERF